MPCSNNSSSKQEPLHEKLIPGSVFLFKDFHFETTDELRDKYGIILSNNCIYYAIVLCFTTSKVQKYKDSLKKQDYVFIQVGASKFFSKDTLVLVRGSNMHEIEKDKITSINPKYLGNLEDTIFKEIITKFKASDRISPFLKGVIGN